ncbi:MAG: hypothetical protein WD969_03945 [Paracoccaceae bacterium]
MAVIDNTPRALPVGAISIFRVVQFFERAIGAVRAKLIAERTHSELAQLSPPQLRDIGLGDRDLSEFSAEIARRRG